MNAVDRRRSCGADVIVDADRVPAVVGIGRSVKAGAIGVGV